MTHKCQRKKGTIHGLNDDDDYYDNGSYNQKKVQEKNV
jgi:hypothetical protein